LGLGDIGPLAAKPVMEGKGILFQKFAGIDVFDIEIDENDPDKLVEIIASLDMLVALGVRPENILAFDREGVIHTGRSNLDPDKARYARDTPKRSLAEIVAGADVFLGLSAGGILKPEMVATMAERPVILALANPNPEITPEDAKAVRPDCIIATGRSDYPNQVN